MSGKPTDDDAELEAALAAAEAAEAAHVPSAKEKLLGKRHGASDASDTVPDGGDAKSSPADKEELGWLGMRWKSLREHVTRKPDPLTSVVFVLPVFLAYSLAVLAIDARVGVDFLSRLVLEQLLRNTAAYVAVHVGVAAVLGGLVWILRKKGKIEPARLLPTIVESLLLAIVLGVLVHVALARLLPVEAAPVVARGATRAAAAAGPGAFARCVLALGAGFYEEVVFRAAVVGTLAWALPKYGSVSSRLTAVIAIAVATVLFVVYAWVVGTEADHSLRAVLGNLLLGVVLGVVYRFRGFAVAVYTHAFFGLVGVAAWALSAR